MASEPVVAIGAADGAEYEIFSGVQAVQFLSDGRILVADAGAGEIRLFGPDGSFDARYGGPGEGPGEFMSLSWAGECEPGVVDAYDVRLGRVTTFRLADGSIETRRIRSSNGRTPRYIFCLGSNALLTATRGTPGAPPRGGGPMLDEMLVEVFPRTGDSLEGRLVTRVPGDDRYFWLFPAELGPRPLGRRTVLATRNETFAVGTQETGEIRVFDATGRLGRTVRWDAPLLPVTDPVTEAYLEARLVREGSQASRAAVRRRYTFAPDLFPAHIPAYDNILFGPEGTLWVEPYPVPGGEEERSWLIFSATGRWLGGVALPRGFRPMSITPDAVVGLWRDALDIEHVWVLDLQRGEADGRGSS